MRLDEEGSRNSGKASEPRGASSPFLLLLQLLSQLAQTCRETEGGVKDGGGGRRAAANAAPFTFTISSCSLLVSACLDVCAQEKKRWRPTEQNGGSPRFVLGTQHLDVAHRTTTGMYVCAVRACARACTYLQVLDLLLQQPLLLLLGVQGHLQLWSKAVSYWTESSRPA